ncbi:MAG: apolipoprotein N-acyltransferase [Flavobacteriaceae bacterium]
MPNKLFLSILFGVLLGLSWPTGGFAPLLFVALVPLLILFERSKTEKRSNIFWRFYLGFFIWNALTTWWLWNATIFGMFFAMLINSLLMTLVVMLWRRVDRKLGQKAGLVFLPFAWICFEKMHLVWDFSWPWLNLGNGFANHPNWVQWYEYTGSFGGTLWIWVVNIAMYKGIKNYIATKKSMQFSRPIFLIAAPLLCSYIILHQFEAEQNEAVNVTVVQPNIDPYNEKYDLTHQELYSNLLAQITPEFSKKPNLIVTPETYFSEGAGENLPKFEQSKLYTDLLDFGTLNNTQFLHGIQFYNTYNEETKSDTANKLENNFWADFYNSAFMTDSAGVHVYHKSKLVVGVETLPYRSLVEPLLGNVMLDFGGTLYVRATQDYREAFPIYGGAKIGPIICYESVYGEFVTEYVRAGASVLAIMTNDAWWGNTPGHKQHLAYARLRAIETRRPIVRAANTGISGFITPLGEITSQLKYDTKGVLTNAVVPQTNTTLYVQYGDYIFRLGGFLAAFIFLFTFARKKN